MAAGRCLWRMVVEVRKWGRGGEIRKKRKIGKVSEVVEKELHKAGKNAIMRSQ